MSFRLLALANELMSLSVFKTDPLIAGHLGMQILEWWRGFYSQE